VLIEVLGVGGHKGNHTEFIEARNEGIGPGHGGPGRLFNTRGPDEIVREKIESLFPGQRFSIQCVFIDNSDPKLVECRLLEAYFQDHCELPPANHSGGTLSTDDSAAQQALAADEGAETPVRNYDNWPAPSRLKRTTFGGSMYADILISHELQ
jgi:hypothetical protein